MTALAPTLQAFFTDRLIRERNVSPHTITAYRDAIKLLLGYAAKRLGREPSQLDIADLDAARSPRSSITSRPSVATAPAPATRAWPRSTRCSATPRCATPSTPTTSNACSRSRPNAADRAIVTFLERTRSTRCSPLPTAAPGPADATTRCSCSPSRPGCAPPSSPASTSPTFNSWRRARHLRRQRTETTDHAVDPDHRRGAARLARRARRQPDDPLFPTIRGRRLSRDALERRLANHLAIAASAARPCKRRASPCTRCDTPQRCGCCTPESTRPSSRYG